MKVVLISLARRGGMVHFQAELANSLARIAPTAVVCSSAVPASYFSAKVQRIVMDTGNGALSSLGQAVNPTSWLRLERVLRNSEADLIHFVGPHEWNPAVALVCKALRKPMIYTAHDPIPHPGAPIPIRLSNAMMESMADAIVVLSRHGRQQLLSIGIPDRKIHLIPHGVYSFFTRDKRKHVKTEKVILFFGRIEAYKGLDILIAAFSGLRGNLDDWKLVIAGSGDLPRWMAQVDRSRIEIINTYLADEEVATLMQRAQMVVIPYTEASQSGVIATAYAFGRPVIATDVGGLNEMVLDGKTGILIPPNDADALAQAMCSLADDGRRRLRMGKNAYQLGQREWSWTAIAQDHLTLYSKVLSG